MLTRCLSHHAYRASVEDFGLFSSPALLEATARSFCFSWTIKRFVERGLLPADLDHFMVWLRDDLFDLLSEINRLSSVNLLAQYHELKDWRRTCTEGELCVPRFFANGFIPLEVLLFRDL